MELRKTSDDLESALCAAMRILGSVVMDEIMKNGGRPVRGEVASDRKVNKCFFKPL